MWKNSSSCIDLVFFFLNWLTANKLTLNIKKSNFVIFSPAQRKFTYQPKIMIFDNEQNKNVALECKDRMWKNSGSCIDLV